MSTSPERDEGATTGLELVVADMQLQNSPASVEPTAQNLSVETYIVDGTPTHGGVPDQTWTYQQTGLAVGEGSSGSGGSGNLSGSSDPNRRRRGRPRRYGPDGTMPLSLMQGPPPGPSRRRTYVRAPRPPSSATATPPSGPFAALPPPGTGLHPHAHPSSSDRPRGIPPGPNNYSRFFHNDFGSGRILLLVRILMLPPGEDIAARIIEISQHVRKPVCVICGCGSLSSVTIREPAAAGGTATYEGTFQLVCLTGSFVPSEFAGRPVMTGGLTVLLHGAVGQIFGGPIAGQVVAATPVQVWLGTVIHERSEGGTVSGDPGSGGGPSSPPSRGPGGETSGGETSGAGTSVAGASGAGTSSAGASDAGPSGAAGSPFSFDSGEGGSTFDPNFGLQGFGFPIGFLNFGWI